MSNEHTGGFEPVQSLKWLFFDLNSYFASVEQQDQRRRSPIGERLQRRARDAGHQQDPLGSAEVAAVHPGQRHQRPQPPSVARRVVSVHVDRRHHVALVVGQGGDRGDHQRRGDQARDPAARPELASRPDHPTQ